MPNINESRSDMDELLTHLSQVPAATTAARVVETLRRLLTEGRIPPGTRLSEEQFAAAFSVSRNTLREAFRLLAHQRLLVHEVNRGVFVRELSRDEIVDLYECRRLIQKAALRSTDQHHPARLAQLKMTIAQAEIALHADDTRGLGTANMDFHAALAALAGNARIDEIMAGLIAELRLAFHAHRVMDQFHREFASENARIADLVTRGEVEEATAALDAYTDRSLETLMASFDEKALGTTCSPGALPHPPAPGHDPARTP